MPRRKKKAVSGWPAAAGKSVKMLKFLKFLKTMKYVKVFVTIGSLAASVFVYSFRLGMWFSVGFVMMILIHELGHIAALKRKGFKTSAPVFIPMLGAVIFAPKLGNREDEAYVGYAGPLIGGIAAAVLLAATVSMSHPPALLSTVTYTALVINFFNLIPIRPLDGGRVTQAVGSWFKYAGVVVLLAVTIALKTPGLLIIWVLVLGDFRMNRYLRTVIAWVIFIAMMVMEWGHFGRPQWFWLNIFDTVLGMMFVLMYGVFAFTSSDDSIDDDERPQLSRQRKIAWFGLYVLLGVFLYGSMRISTHYLPPSAR